MAEKSSDHDFRVELAGLLNKYNKENATSTPDFILANYLIRCLETYDDIVRERDQWHGLQMKSVTQQLGNE